MQAAATSAPRARLCKRCSRLSAADALECSPERYWQEHLAELQAEVASHSYAPQPLGLVRIPKRHGGQRILAVPALRNRVLQTAVAQRIGPLLERYLGADSPCYGYRPGRSVARVQACRNAGLVYMVEASIDHFFDEIDHARLLQLPGQQVAVR